jgi:transcriptional regulator of acetoin/glycerol metabolism
MRAWESFLAERDEEEPGDPHVRPLIQQSWHRCALSSIDATRGEAPLAGGAAGLEELGYASRELRDAARDSFARVGRLLEGAQAMLILTDHEGVIVETIGDRQTLEDGRRIHLEVGGVWSERVVGTNGIGTALWTGEPVFVHAAEHFCAGIKAWSCAGVPVRDPFDNRVVGVVDLSGLIDIFRPHNTALVALAAQEIEGAMARRQNEERTRLLETFLGSRLNTGHEDGVILLDRLGRVIYARRAPDRAQIGGVEHDIRLGLRLLDLSDRMSDADLAAALPEGLRPRDVSRLRIGTELSGAALVFRRERHSPRAASPEAHRGDGGQSLIIGRSPALREAVELARRFAGRGTSVLIEGETGVGKELFARLVHAEPGRRPNAPFVPVNCGAIGRELFGGELFGHMPGAFTGASREGRPGKFELADGGVLCLDEIGEMPLDIQPYLLRVLEDRIVYRIGDSKGRQVDVDLVALTNRDLKVEVAAGRFRRDLYYRIGTVTISVPPLRERGDDVALLVEHFNRQIAAQTGQEPLTFPDPVMAVLLAYGWPGNVRELKNLIVRLHMVVRDRIVHLAHLPAGLADAPARAPAPPAGAVESIDEATRQAVVRAIAAQGGNLSKVAQALGISRPTLYRKLKLYGIRS